MESVPERRPCGRRDGRQAVPTHALVWDANWLRAKCEEDHDLGYEMLKRFVDLIATRLDATRLQLQDIYAVHS